jgi:hypothetical protein
VVQIEQQLNTMGFWALSGRVKAGYCYLQDAAAARQALALIASSLPDCPLMCAVLQVLDIVFTVVFSIEAVLKILVKGVVFTGPDAYMRNAWNVLDFIVVVTGEAVQC